MEASSLPTDPPIWIDTAEALQTLANDLLREPHIGVDTEANSLHAYREQVCLLQFSTPTADYLVDPLALDDLSPLAPVFASPHVEKIFHAAEYDILGLHRDFGFTFNNLFDTMVSARILGYEKVGLGALLEQHFGIRLAKRFQKADWGQRPLPPEMLDYARLDTHFLIPLRNILYRQLEAKDLLPLAQEDFARLTHPLEGTGRPPLWQRGGHHLTPQQTAVLEALWRYRESEAEHRDVPPFKILDDKTLVALARALPRSRGDLQRVPGMSPGRIRRYGKRVLEVIKQGLNAPPQILQRPPRPDDAYLARLEALRRWRQTAAKAMGVPSDVVLPKSHMQAIAAANPTTLDELRPLMADIPWRFAKFGAEILQVLAAANSTSSHGH
ncbi:MAG: ribonuclease D [Chloroflexi bacterium]|nr:ribonuclease D [Chloroflexota bacterium]